MLLALTEAAEYLGMTPHGLRKLVKRGGIAYFQHGQRGRLKFKPEWLDQFIDNSTHKPRQFTPKPGRQPKRPAKPMPTASGLLGFRPEFFKR